MAVYQQLTADQLTLLTELNNEADEGGSTTESESLSGDSSSESEEEQANKELHCQTVTSPVIAAY